MTRAIKAFYTAQTARKTNTDKQNPSLPALVCQILIGTADDLNAGHAPEMYRFSIMRRHVHPHPEPLSSAAPAHV